MKVNELLKEAEGEIKTFAQLKAKYGMKAGPKYHDSDTKNWIAATPKGQRLFDVDVGRDYKTDKIKYDVRGKSWHKSFKTVPELAAFLATKKFDSVQDKELTDEQVTKKISKELQSTIKMKDWPTIKYIVWANSVELQDAENHLPYNQWKEGDGHRDDNYSLSGLMMTKADFIAWLNKVGAKKKAKPKSSGGGSWYD